MNNELWKEIDNYDNYMVSNYGNIKNTKTNRYLKTIVDNKRYLIVSLCKNGIVKTHSIHRLVANAFLSDPDHEDQTCIDHINHQTRDNHYLNLRWCNKFQNGQNRTKQKNTSSIYKGVYFNKPNKKWCATIHINGKKKHLGYFQNDKDAAIAYNDAASFNFGEFSNLNIID